MGIDDRVGDTPVPGRGTGGGLDAGVTSGDDSPAIADVQPPEAADRTARNVRYHEKVQAEFRLAEAYALWDDGKPKFEQQWADHVQGWPACGEKEVAPLSEEACDAVRRGCSEFRETEEKITTPAMLRVESADPQRHLVGLEHRLKGEDRIMEKAARQMESQPDLTPAEAVALIKDAIRYTFQYSEDHYTEGVDTDIKRFKLAGFELVELRNSWGNEEYKGINSRWRVPENGQIFEVQFHTNISFEAKQLTHPAYERLRNPSTSKAERDELEGFKRSVNTYVPIPQDALIYPDYP